MRNENFTHGCAPNASVVHSESGQATVKLGQEPSILYDLVDLEKYSKSQREHFLIGGQRVLSAL